MAVSGGSLRDDLGLFFFGSFKYQIHKNALTYGMLMIIVATFCGFEQFGLARGYWRERGWWAWIAQITCFRFVDWMISFMPIRCCLSSA